MLKIEKYKFKFKKITISKKVFSSIKIEFYINSNLLNNHQWWESLWCVSTGPSSDSRVRCTFVYSGHVIGVHIGLCKKA